MAAVLIRIFTEHIPQTRLNIIGQIRDCRHIALALYAQHVHRIGHQTICLLEKTPFSPPVNSKFHHKTVVFIIFTKTNKNTAKNSLFSTQYSLWHGMGNMVLYIRKPCTIFFMKKLQSGVKINDLCIGTENIFISPRLFFQDGRVPRRIFCEERIAIAFVIPGKSLSKKKIQY